MLTSCVYATRQFLKSHIPNITSGTRPPMLALTQTWCAAVQHLMTCQMALGGWFLNLLTSCVSSMELLQSKANNTLSTRALTLQEALLEDTLLLCSTVLVTTLPSQNLLIRCCLHHIAWDKVSYVHTEQIKKSVGGNMHYFVAISHWNRESLTGSLRAKLVQTKNSFKSESCLQHGCKWHLRQSNLCQGKYVQHLPQTFCVLPPSTSGLVSTKRNPVCAMWDHSLMWGLSGEDQRIHLKNTLLIWVYAEKGTVEGKLTSIPPDPIWTSWTYSIL